MCLILSSPIKGRPWYSGNKMIKGLGHTIRKERPSEACSVWGQGSNQADLITLLNFHVGVNRKVVTWLLLDAHSNKTGRNKHNLENGTFLLAEKKSSFPTRVAKHCKKLLRDPVAPLSPDLLKISRHSLEQSTPVRLTFKQGFELNDCQRSLPT